MSQALTRIAVVSAAILIAGCGTHGNTQGSNVNVTVNDETLGPEIDGSGKPGSETRDVSDFRKIRADGKADITVRMGKRPSVMITGDANLLPSIVARSQDGLLTVSERGDIRSTMPLRIAITVPSLEHLTTDGADIIHLDGIKAKRLAIDLNGSGNVDGNGTADALSLDLSGSGNAGLTDLRARQTDVSVSGSGNASVTATQAISAGISGTGNIVYSGNPHVVTKSVTGTGSVSAKQDR